MTDSLAITLNALGAQLVFDHVSLIFQEGEFQNVFAKKNNKTVDETLSGRKYAFLRPEVEKTYPSHMDMEIGAFVLFLKERGDLLYQRFLNRNGDELYCRFSIEEHLNDKGLYLYRISEDISYIGKTLSSFGSRTNNGYGRISPKNCFLDGQSTNCHVNYLVCRYRELISFYVCPLQEDELISKYEQDLIERLNPSWNVQLKRKNKE